MFKAIRRLLSKERLCVQIQELEEENTRLREELGRKLINPGPAYGAVAKDFDPGSKLTDAVLSKVVDDLAPILEEDALLTLKQMFGDFRQRYNGTPGFIGASVAMDITAAQPVFEYEFRIRKGGGTRVRAMY